jgi:hypothetical protein
MRPDDSGSASATFISTPTRRIEPRCRALAASGHTAAPPSSVMSSRRRISAPCLGNGILSGQMSTLIGTELASKPLPQCICQTLPDRVFLIMSGLPPVAPELRTSGSAASCQKRKWAILFDHLVGQQLE